MATGRFGYVQFLGDRAFQISPMEAANLRWEAKQFRPGKLWHRWDYPHAVGSPVFEEQYPVFAMYFFLHIAGTMYCAPYIVC